MQLTYGSVCSGIEAASIAWEPLGLKPAWFSEIEAFPSAVLAHHWPHVRNLGDMTKIAAAVRAGTVPAPDIGVGGTPCQAFSVAGARAGLSDPRGQLTISYVELADAIDDTRTAAGKQPAIFVWENVPGVLSSKDNAFGAFLGLLAGEDCELQPPGGKWKNAGCVLGPKRTIAWRVIDAQYFGVAQRRRRVFVVASARTDFDPRKVFFESEGVRRDTAPSRSAGSAVAALTANGVGTCGADDNQGQAGHLIPTGSHWDNAANPHPTLSHSNSVSGIGGSNQEVFCQRGAGIVAAFGGGNCSGPIEVATACTAHGVRMDFDTETFLAQYSSTGHGAWAEGPGTLRAREQESHEHLAVMAVHGTQDPDTLNELAHTLGRNQGQENAVIAFNSKDHGQDAAEEISPTLRSAGHSGSHANAGAPPAVAYGFQPRIARNGRGDMGDVCHALTAEAGETGKGDSAPCVAYSGFDILGTPASEVAKEADVHTPLRARVPGQFENSTVTMVANGMAVRRLTPVECERLQGFPDCWTAIPTDKRKQITADEYAYLRHHKPELTAEQAYKLAADGPRYKAIGNSMATPCMSWIGKRILQQLEGAM